MGTLGLMAIALTMFTGVLAPAAHAADSTPVNAAATVAKVKYVASKSGGKYHLPACASAGQITAENRVSFKSKADAEKAGYKACEICKP
jgi:hypothetical protein